MQAAIKKLKMLPPPPREERPVEVMDAIKRQQDVYAAISRLSARRRAAMDRVSLAPNNLMWRAAWDAVYDAELELEEAEEELWKARGDEVAARWRWHRRIILDAVEKALNSTPRRRRKAAK